MSLTEDSKNKIKELLLIEEKITQLKEALKRFTDKKKKLELDIEKVMIVSKIKKINLPGGTVLKTYVKKTRESCTKKWVQSRLQTYCDKNKLNYDELEDFIYNPEYRKCVEKTTIKKQKPRKKKN